MQGRLPASDTALDAYNEVLCMAILKAISIGGAPAALEFLTTLAQVTGRDVQEYIDELEGS